MLKSPSLILGRFPFAAKTAHSNRVLNDDGENWDEDQISHDDKVGHSLVDVGLGECLEFWEGGGGGEGDVEHPTKASQVKHRWLEREIGKTVLFRKQCMSKTDHFESVIVATQCDCDFQKVCFKGNFTGSV